MRTIAAQVVGCTACTFPKTLQAAITSRPSLSTINTAALSCTSGNLFILASAGSQIARTPGQRRSVFALSPYGPFRFLSLSVGRRYSLYKWIVIASTRKSLQVRSDLYAGWDIRTTAKRGEFEHFGFASRFRVPDGGSEFLDF